MIEVNAIQNMRARYYNPEIKRFVNRDVVTGSIGNGLTMNWYAYVNGNPVSYTDPFERSTDGAEWLKQGGSFVADATLFVGTAKGIQEVFTSVDLITGQQLSVKGTVEAGVWLIGKLGKMEVQAAQKKYANLQICS